MNIIACSLPWYFNGVCWFEHLSPVSCRWPALVLCESRAPHSVECPWPALVLCESWAPQSVQCPWPALVLCESWAPHSVQCPWPALVLCESWAPQSVQCPCYGLKERRKSSVFLFTTEFGSSLRFAHSPGHYSLGALPKKVRRPWRDVNVSLPSNSEV